MAGDKAVKVKAQRAHVPVTQSAVPLVQAKAATALGRVAEAIRTSPVMQDRSAAAAGLRGSCDCDPAVPRDPVRRDVAQRSAMRAPAFDPALVQRAAAPNRTGLPDRLKANIEAMSGFAMDDVRVHRNSEKPAQLRAHAYTQGSQIHLGPGQEKHLPHEAWHVVQQKQGRVKPTLQMKGVAINDGRGLEKEADAMGRKASNIASLRNMSLSGIDPKGSTVQCMLGLSSLHRTGLRSANVSPRSVGTDDKKSGRRAAGDDKKSRMALSEAMQNRIMKDLNDIVEINAETFQEYFDELFRGDKATSSNIAKACMRVKDSVDDLDLNERTKRDIRSEIKDSIDRSEYQEKVKSFAAFNFAQPIAQDYTSIMKSDGGIEQLVNEAKEAAIAKFPWYRLNSTNAYQTRLQAMVEHFIKAVGKILHKAMQAHPDERKALSTRLMSRGGIFAEIANALFQESVVPAVRVTDASLDAKNYQTGNDEKSAIPIVFYKKKEHYNLLKTIEPKVKNGAFKTLKLGEELKLPAPYLGKAVGKPNFARIEKGATIKDNSQHGSTRPNSGKFREMLNTYYNYNSSQYDIDHIWDLGFGGKDEFSNLWPLDPAINRRPIGGWRSAYLLHYKNNKGVLWRGPIATLYAKWFVIKGFMPASGGDIPAESGKPEAGKK